MISGRDACSSYFAVASDKYFALAGVDFITRKGIDLEFLNSKKMLYQRD